MGYTQKELAERVGLKEQQIQRYEETEYSAASFSRLKEIIEALGLDVKEKKARDQKFSEQFDSGYEQIRDRHIMK